MPRPFLRRTVHHCCRARAALLGAACAALLGACSSTAPALAPAPGAAGDPPTAVTISAARTATTTTATTDDLAPPAWTPERLGADYRALGEAGGQVWVLDPAASAVRIYVFRGGKAAQYGHNHVLSAPRFEGYFHAAPQGLLASRFDLAFRLDALAVDLPQHRAATGGAFASELSAAATESTRDNMLGAFGLQAAQYPWVRIRSLQIAGDTPKFAAQVAITLHGQTRAVWVPLQVSGLPDRLLVQGATVLQQTDFGVKPFSVLGGLLSVQDPLVVEFTLRGTPLQAPGAAPVPAPVLLPVPVP